MYLLNQFLKGKRYVDVNIKNTKGNNYLHLAVRCCKNETLFLNIVSLLIQEDAYLGLQNKQGDTALDLMFRHIQNPVEFVTKEVLDKSIEVLSFQVLE